MQYTYQSRHLHLPSPYMSYPPSGLLLADVEEESAPHSDPFLSPKDHHAPPT